LASIRICDVEMRLKLAKNFLTSLCCRSLAKTLTMPVSLLME